MYFITAMTEVPGDARCFGYYETEKDARRAVEKNLCDMHEYLYSYLVIEEVDSGIHQYAIEIQWYIWQDGKWTETEKPKCKHGWCNFSIG